MLTPPLAIGIIWTLALYNISSTADTITRLTVSDRRVSSRHIDPCTATETKILFCRINPEKSSAVTVSYRSWNGILNLNLMCALR